MWASCCPGAAAHSPVASCHSGQGCISTSWYYFAADIWLISMSVYFKMVLQIIDEMSIKLEQESEFSNQTWLAYKSRTTHTYTVKILQLQALTV